MKSAPKKQTPRSPNKKAKSLDDPKQLERTIRGFDRAPPDAVIEQLELMTDEQRQIFEKGHKLAASAAPASSA